MKGKIVNYRMGRQTQNPYHMIIKVEGVATKDEAKALKGKKVIWKTPGGKEITGKVASAHGNKGAIRVIFDRGMPGQSIGGEVSIN